MYKIHLYIKDPNEAKYKYLIDKHKKLVLKSKKIQKLFLDIKIVCRMSIKILMSTTQIENINY